jgi:hypothetical protein
MVSFGWLCTECRVPFYGPRLCHASLAELVALMIQGLHALFRHWLAMRCCPRVRRLTKGKSGREESLGHVEDQS